MTPSAGPGGVEGSIAAARYRNGQSPPLFGPPLSPFAALFFYFEIRAGSTGRSLSAIRRRVCSVVSQSMQASVTETP